MENYNIDKQLEKALTREPDFHLPHDFADRLVSRMEESRKKERQWEILYISLAGFLFLIALGVVFVLTDFKPTLGVLSFLGSHIKFIVFGVLFIGLLQLLDKKLLHKIQEN
jgi:hypothetical protein